MRTLSKKLDTAFSFRRPSGQKVVVVEIRKCSIVDWIAILWMLTEDLGRVMILGSNTRRCHIQLANVDAASVDEKSDIQLRMTRDTTTALGVFLIQSYRDDYSPVDHIDFNCDFGSSSGYLTFKVDNLIPLRSAEEAWNVLGPKS